MGVVGGSGGGRVGRLESGPGGVGPGGKFRAFFSLPPEISFFLLSLGGGVFSWNFVVFEAPGRSNVRVWSSQAIV